jgi:hypothetical protein
MEQIEALRKTMEHTSSRMVRISIETYHAEKGWETINKLGHERSEKIEIFGIEEKYAHLNGIYNSINDFLQKIIDLQKGIQEQCVVDGITCTMVESIDYISERSFGVGVIFGPGCSIFGHWQYL